MRRLFILGFLVAVITEILRVYFIMPMPGSQSLNFIQWAYFIHQWRWIFRILGVALMFVGFLSIWKQRPILTFSLLTVYLAVTLLFNFKLSADKMFYQPANLQYETASQSTLDSQKWVLGFHWKGESKAWPIQYLAYHHQVRDVVGGEPVMVTYCSVCRTGRVFSPKVDGVLEQFRLVGMDHFNAMFEDSKTGSWWRQVNGLCIAGPLKGKKLTEMVGVQTPLNGWLSRYPDSKIMKADPSFQHEYDDLEGFDEGTLISSLEGTDSGSWNDKSWVLGAIVQGRAVCWDWKNLKANGPSEIQIHGKTYRAQILSDGKQFKVEYLRNFNVTEKMVSVEVPSYQEFWHSWSTFHPNTIKAN
jgi:hypothetical protein